MVPALPVPTPTTGTPSPTLWAAWVRVVSRRGKGGKSQQLPIMCAFWRQDSHPNQCAKAVTGFYTSAIIRIKVNFEAPESLRRGSSPTPHHRLLPLGVQTCQAPTHCSQV